MILDGEAEVTRDDGSGSRRVIRKLGKGECFGDCRF